MKSIQLTPELAVTSIVRSKAFYCDLLGFEIKYERPEEGFAFIALDEAHIMLDQIDKGRIFGDNLSSKPLGAGVNLQIFIDDDQQTKMLKALDRSELSLFLELEEKWYRTGKNEVGNKQFVVADPDGYLLRFAVNLGSRAL